MMLFFQTCPLLTQRGWQLSGIAYIAAAGMAIPVMTNGVKAAPAPLFEVSTQVMTQGSPVTGGRVQPNWIDGSSFWYLASSRDGVRYVYVDAEPAKSSVLFNQKQLDAALLKASPQSGGDLVQSGEVLEINHGSGIGSWIAKARYGTAEMICALAAALTCQPEGTDLRPGELESPDGVWRVSVTNHNLYVRRSGTNERVQLTFDGEKDNGYENISRSDSDVVGDEILERSLGPSQPQVQWSPDSRHLLAVGVDMRGTREVYLIQSSTPSGAPEVHTLKKPWSGDANIGTAQVVVIDVSTKTVWKSDGAVNFAQTAGWYQSGKAIWILQYSRGAGESRLWRVDVADHFKSGPKIIETDAHPVHHAPSFYDGIYGSPAVEVADPTMLIWSERDGWGHLYLIDTRTGKTIRQVTSGAWTVDTIVSIDQARQQVYFTARGREKGRDVYKKHLYRVNYAHPAAPVLLTPEDANHQESGGSLSPDHRFFVDAFSNVATPPQSVLRNADGRLIMALEKAEFVDEAAATAPLPERFVVRSADNSEDIYGILYKPRNFSPDKHYPILDDYYPGMFMTVEPSFGENQSAQASAEIGAIVVRIAGRGTSFRSKAFRGFGYGSLGMSGIVDHIAAIRTLATSRPYMDVSRVGIYGNSAGGDGTIRALIDHGEFFKVGVASGMSGANFFTHEPLYGELWLGDPFKEREKWLDMAAETHVDKIRGKLLVLHGEMDDHANPAYAMQFVNAALNKNVDIDAFFVPNVDHVQGNVQTGDVIDVRMQRRKWSYLRQWLGLTAP